MAEEADDAASKRQLLENPEAYVAEIDSMSLEELEEQLPYAQDLLETIETKLEEAMSSRDAALVCAAAMSARLAALKQAKG
jgi:hypothetical protein